MKNHAVALRSRARVHGKSLARATSLSAIACSIGWSSSSLAQAELQGAAVVQEGAVEEAPSRGLDEIVVTAQRRAESVQDVPISVSVLAASDIRSMGATDTNALSGKIPSLSVVNTGSHLYFLRGVGTTGSSINSEQSVASYIDGVYLYSTWSAAVPLGGVERVEVLKGPQGTLFGRNTTGGVIQVVTRDPLADPTAEFSFGYGNYRTVTNALYLSTKIGENFGVSLTADYRNQGEGYGFNTVRQVDSYFANNESVQLKAAFEPMEGTKLTGFFWYNHYDSSGNNAQIVPGLRGLDGVLRDLGRFQYVADTEDKLEYRSYLGYVRLEQSLGFADFVSISSYRKVDTIFRLDQDTVPITVVDATLDIPLHNYAQEFQLLSKDKGRLTWLLGAYYFKGSAEYDPITIAGLGGGPARNIQFFRKQKTESLAGFAQATLEVIQGTNVTAGIRYTDETQRMPVSRTASRGVTLFTSPADELDSSGWTWRFAVDQKLGQDAMVYASYNRGLKSGGFPLVTPRNIPAFKPEKLDAFEVGVKTELFGRRLRLNVAAFLYKFKDIQVNVVTTGGNITRNAAAAELKGVDLDFEARPFENLKLFGAFGWLDGQYTSFLNAVEFVPRPTGGASTRALDATGNGTVYSPEISASFGGSYDIPSKIGNLFIDGFVQYVDSQFVGPDNKLTLPSYTVVNGSIGWRPDGEGFGIRAWVQNLFDEQYRAGAVQATVGFTATPSPPRTYGLTLNAKF